MTNIDFVGSNKMPDCGFPYDADNEGHSGFLATDIARDNLLAPWLSAQKPDVIVMHLGTNDVVKRKSKEEIIDAYDTLVDQMRKSKGGMKIIVSILPNPLFPIPQLPTHPPLCPLCTN
jgi:lysophospholipase L1-like esterase